MRLSAVTTSMSCVVGGEGVRRWAGPAAVESVRLDPELRRDLLLRAAADGRSVSQVTRAALHAYLEAS